MNSHFKGKLRLILVIERFHFSVLFIRYKGVLLIYMYVNRVFGWYPWRSERALVPLETELQRVVSQHVGAGFKINVFYKTKNY